MAAPLRLKIFFWFILSMLSVFFAEVVSGSELFGIISPKTIFFLFPLYGLHTIILAYLIYKFGRPNLYNLFLAGAIFGMYEAYITKVLWAGWETPALLLGGISVIETVVLVLFWHPWFAFIIPLLIAETWLTKSRTVASAMPRFANLFKKKWIWILIFFFGILQTASSKNVPFELISIFFSGTIIYFFIKNYKWTSASKYNIEDLLPSKTQVIILSVLLFLYYVIVSMLFNPDKWPGFISHVSTWIIYAVLIVLFVRKLKVPKVKLKKFDLKFSFKTVHGFALFFAIGIIVSSYVPGLNDLFMLIAWIVCCLIGFFILIKSVFKK